MSRVERAYSWKLRVDEIFQVTKGTPFKRTDGYWGGISATRFFKYRSMGQFANRRLGCGSVPTYALQDPADATRMPVSIMHFGYAREEDRQAKFDRYTSVLNNGHSSSHIQSILQLPTLEEIPKERNPL